MPTTPAQQAHYIRNKDRYIAQSKEQRLRIRLFVQEQKSKPCADCGIEYPFYVMQFDHVRGKKVDNISQMLSRNNLPEIVEEIAKCDVVCANCHAVRSFKRSSGTGV